MSETRTAEYWRAKAAETRMLADGRTGESKRALLDVAKAYDKLAGVTESR
jgi:hypothetical protein